MASSLDDDWLDFDEDNVDRNIDHRDYLRQHLKIFKDEYRETAYESEQESTQTGFDHGFNRCIAFCRQLGRAKGALKTLNPRNDVTKTSTLKLLDNIESCLGRIRNVHFPTSGSRKPKWDTVDESGEFDLDFANRALPKFDQDDMEMFLGESRDGNTMESGDIEIGSDQWKGLLDALEKETSEILVNVCGLLHAHGICDGFIYA